MVSFAATALNNRPKAKICDLMTAQPESVCASDTLVCAARKEKENIGVLPVATRQRTLLGSLPTRDERSRIVLDVLAMPKKGTFLMSNRIAANTISHPQLVALAPDGPMSSNNSSCIGDCGTSDSACPAIFFVDEYEAARLMQQLRRRRRKGKRRPSADWQQYVVKWPRFCVKGRMLPVFVPEPSPYIYPVGQSLCRKCT